VKPVPADGAPTDGAPAQDKRDAEPQNEVPDGAPAQDRRDAAELRGALDTLSSLTAGVVALAERPQPAMNITIPVSVDATSRGAKRITVGQDAAGNPTYNIEQE
jgi:hypothetical protein